MWVISWPVERLSVSTPLHPPRSAVINSCTTVWTQTLITHNAFANKRPEASVTCGSPPPIRRQRALSLASESTRSQEIHRTFPRKASLTHSRFEVFVTIGAHEWGPRQRSRAPVNKTIQPPHPTSSGGPAKSLDTKSEIFCVIAPFLHDIFVVKPDYGLSSGRNIETGCRCACAVTLRGTPRTSITRLILNTARLTHNTPHCCHNTKVNTTQ